VPVATDGFFVIDAEGPLASVDAATSGIQLVVTDDMGVSISGEITLLENKQPGSATFRHSM